ncbi:hypothetical protein CKO15_00760 [Halorhodospira abdelmalekii]|uniref:hypothetical protein n=1 Tax=Halorhodospira abdelmalekii TaxID=421629 RepID=UPI00190460F2|nr:hypothetical protein [Halorhodospira abdelmalekii]MBK1733832.1 hypothetical protein [Halorhodospira abdelmalekii]
MSVLFSGSVSDHRLRDRAALFLFGCVATFLVLIGVTPAKAETFDDRVLVVVDESEGESSVAGALARTGLEETATIVDDLSGFERELSANDYDLVIVGAQRSGEFASAVAPVVESYVDDGGRVVATIWTGESLARVLSAEPVSENDERIQTDAHPIFQAASMAETEIDLDNPGWTVFSRSWRPLGDAEGVGQLGDGAALVIGNEGRTAVIGPLFDSFDDVQEGERFVANVMRWILTGGATPPEISTAEPDIHSPAVAELSGVLEDPGDAAVDLYLELGTTPDLADAQRHSTRPEVSSEPTVFSYRAEDLDPGEVYYFRAVGISRAGHVEGEIRELAVSTAALDLPQLEGLWSDTELRGVTLSASWSEAPDLEPEWVGFEYVPAGGDFADIERVSANMEDETLTAELRGLHDGEAYHVRAVAEFGDDRTATASDWVRLQLLGLGAAGGA